MKRGAPLLRLAARHSPETKRLIKSHHLCDYRVRSSRVCTHMLTVHWPLTHSENRRGRIVLASTRETAACACVRMHLCADRSAKPEIVCACVCVNECVDFAGAPIWVFWCSR